MLRKPPLLRVALQVPNKHNTHAISATKMRKEMGI